MGSRRTPLKREIEIENHLRVIHHQYFVRFIAFVPLCLLFFCSTLALDRDRTLTQLHHTAWSAKDGAPTEIRAIAQTTDGYLWLGTATGLYRFDGIIFDKYEPLSGGPFPSNNISRLFSLPDGGLLIAYRYGDIGLLNDGKLTNYGKNEGVPEGRAMKFASDKDGVIWVAGSFGLIRFKDSMWQKIGSDWNFPTTQAYSVLVDTRGTLWVTTEDTVLNLPRGSTTFQPTGTKCALVFTLAEAPDGTIWMAEGPRSVRPLLFPDFAKNEPGFELQVGSASILFDREGSLWAASIGDGLRRVPSPDGFRGQKIAQFSDKAEIFTEKDGLSGNYCNTVFQDKDGNIWVGTAKGLDRFRASEFVTVRFPPQYQNFALAPGDHGDIWTVSSNQSMTLISGDTVQIQKRGIAANIIFRDIVGALWTWDSRFLYRIKGGKYELVATPPGGNILTIAGDRNGTLWIFQSPHGLYSLKDRVWEHQEHLIGLPKAEPIHGTVDSLDRKWLAYPANTVAMIDGETTRVFTADDGLQTGDIRVIDAKYQRVWAGGEFGLAVLDGDKFRMVYADEPEAFSNIYGIVETAEGDIWLNEGRGIVHLPASEIDLALRSADHRVKYRLFDSLDGLPGSPQMSLPYPTAAEGTDGRLWFSTDAGVVWIDPKKTVSSPPPPPVAINSVKTDADSYEPLPSLQLPKGLTSLSITYTALSLGIPERVRFRYRLEGVDQDWQNAGTRREAFYTNLGPGSYRFQVIAANGDGIWNNDGAALEFEILPRFYQTNWFLLICVGAVGVFGIGAYQWRLYHLKSRLQHQFEERLSERTRIAQDLHDTLLQGVVSAAMQLDVATERVGEQSPAKPMLDHINGLMSNVIAEGRNALKGLRLPTINYLSDLEQRLSEVRQDLDMGEKVDFRMTVTGQPRPLLSAVGEETHQICREALTNAFRHSGGTLVEVEIEYSPRQFRIVVRDNGLGIDPEILAKGRDGHFGLSGIRERAHSIGGQLKIYSRASGGTEVELSVPGRLTFESHLPNIVSRWFNFRNRPRSRSGTEV